MKKQPIQNNKNSVQMHIETAFVVINEFLPSKYTKLVFSKLPKDFEVTEHNITKVRRKRLNPKKNLIVLKALYEVALENKNANETFLKTLKK
jgi:hypothetical protein